MAYPSIINETLNRIEGDFKKYIEQGVVTIIKREDCVEIVGGEYGAEYEHDTIRSLRITLQVQPGWKSASCRIGQFGSEVWLFKSLYRCAQRAHALHGEFAECTPTSFEIKPGLEVHYELEKDVIDFTLAFLTH